MLERNRATRDSQLARVVYRSHSLVSEAEDGGTGAVSDILRVARRNNTLTGLTGVLLFDGASFLQAIEGQIDEVETVYEAIACDLRHEDIEVIEFTPIVTRSYRSFPMAYVEGLAAEHDTLRHLLSMLTASVAGQAGGDAVPAAE